VVVVFSILIKTLKIFKHLGSKWYIKIMFGVCKNNCCFGGWIICYWQNMTGGGRMNNQRQFDPNYY
jgi:hypothetical protein